MLAIKTNRADLERKKLIFFEIGIIISLLLIWLAFNIKTTTRSNSENFILDLKDQAEEMVPVTIQETKPPPPPPPVPAAITKITLVDNDVEVGQDIEINAEATQETVIPEYIPPAIEDYEEEEEVVEEPIFVVVESMPEFPGGLTALMRYLSTSIHYPALARESNIKGTVFVSFVIEKDGSVTDIKVLRGIGGGCDKEAIRVIENMPKWKAGRQRNVPVRVKYCLPIKFVLQS